MDIPLIAGIEKIDTRLPVIVKNGQSGIFLFRNVSFLEKTSIGG